MSTCLRLNCAKTERKHPDPTAIQDSAVASQTLNLALKKEELCIAINLAINRKRTCLGSPNKIFEHSPNTSAVSRLRFNPNVGAVLDTGAQRSAAKHPEEILRHTNSSHTMQGAFGKPTTMNGILIRAVQLWRQD